MTRIEVSNRKYKIQCESSKFKIKMFSITLSNFVCESIEQPKNSYDRKENYEVEMKIK